MLVIEKDGLPAAIVDSCEPCRVLPRRPSATWERAELDAAARWALLRKNRAKHAIKWPKIASAERRPHVAPILARFESADPPTSLLAPEIEATWLWLETVKAAAPSDSGEQTVDVWASIDVSVAVESLTAFVAAEDREGAQMEEPRRLRAHLSCVDEPAWAKARAVAERLRTGASPDTAALLAYLFPEDDTANPLARKVKKLTGYQHLLALSVTDPELLASLVNKGGDAWGLVKLQGFIPAWAVATMGPKAAPVIEAVGKRWPQNVAVEREWLTSQAGQTGQTPCKK